MKFPKILKEMLNEISLFHKMCISKVDRNMPGYAAHIESMLNRKYVIHKYSYKDGRELLSAKGKEWIDILDTRIIKDKPLSESFKDHPVMMSACPQDPKRLVNIQLMSKAKANLDKQYTNEVFLKNRTLVKNPSPSDQNICSIKTISESHFAEGFEYTAFPDQNEQDKIFNENIATLEEIEEKFMNNEEYKKNISILQEILNKKEEKFSNSHSLKEGKPGTGKVEVEKMDSQIHSSFEEVGQVSKNKVKKIYHYQHNSREVNGNGFLEVEILVNLLLENLPHWILSIVVTVIMYINNLKDLIELAQINNVEVQIHFNNIKWFLSKAIEVIGNPNFINLLQEVESFLVTHQESVLKVIEYLIQNGW